MIRLLSDTEENCLHRITQHIRQQGNITRRKRIAMAPEYRCRKSDQRERQRDHDDQLDEPDKQFEQVSVCFSEGCLNSIQQPKHNCCPEKPFYVMQSIYMRIILCDHS